MQKKHLLFIAISLLLGSCSFGPSANKIIKNANYSFEYIDLGGGMGIDYKNDKKIDNVRNR